jgi:hypothetical protein
MARSASFTGDYSSTSSLRILKMFQSRRSPYPYRFLYPYRYLYLYHLCPRQFLPPYLFLALLNQNLFSSETLSMNRPCRQCLFRWYPWCHHPEDFVGPLSVRQTLPPPALTLLHPFALPMSAREPRRRRRTSNRQAGWTG